MQEESQAHEPPRMTASPPLLLPATSSFSPERIYEIDPGCLELVSMHAWPKTISPPSTSRQIRLGSDCLVAAGEAAEQRGRAGRGVDRDPDRARQEAGGELGLHDKPAMIQEHHPKEKYPELDFPQGISSLNKPLQVAVKKYPSSWGDEEVEMFREETHVLFLAAMRCHNVCKVCPPRTPADLSCVIIGDASLEGASLSLSSSLPPPPSPCLSSSDPSPSSPRFLAPL